MPRLGVVRMLATADGFTGTPETGGTGLEDDLKGLVLQSDKPGIDQPRSPQPRSHQPLSLWQPERPTIVNTTNAHCAREIRMI